MCTKLSRLTASKMRQAGISLLELVMFIVIIGIALVGILLVMNQTTAHSADALVHKQALSIAESLLEEVELMPFTWCDPDDPSAVSAVGYAGCNTPQNVTPSSYGGNPEHRGDLNFPFDNVLDYNGYNMAPIVDINGNGVGLNGYAANVNITPVGNAYLGAADNDAGLRITVTVTSPQGEQLQLDGYRARYAPQLSGP
jgi:MSHA pilin protein MshD